MSSTLGPVYKHKEQKNPRLNNNDMFSGAAATAGVGADGTDGPDGGGDRGGGRGGRQAADNGADETADETADEAADLQKDNLNVFSVWRNPSLALSTGSPIARGSPAPVEMTSSLPCQQCVWVVSGSKKEYTNVQIT